MIISNPYKISKLKEDKRKFENGEIDSYQDGKLLIKRINIKYAFSNTSKRNNIRKFKKILYEKTEINI